MDLDTEKEKARYLFKLDFIKMIVDKLLLGIILGLIGLGFNVAIENYKSKQIEKQFYLDKKLSAINEINDAYQRIISIYTWVTLPDTDKARSLLITNKSDLEYHKAIINFATATNKKGLFLSQKLTILCQNSILIFEGIFYKLQSQRAEYYDFLMHLADIFTDQLRVEVGELPELDEKEVFSFDKLNLQEIRSKGSDYFLDISFKKWKQNKKLDK